MHTSHSARTLLLAAIVSASLLGTASRARSQDIGYSYIRIAVKGVPVSNFSENPKYKGWLQILIADVSSSDRTIDTVKTVARSRGAITDPMEIAWKDAARMAKSGRPGRIEFVAGDDGGFDPLFAAMKHRTMIPAAEIEIYNIDTNEFAGGFKIKGIRAVSIKDNPASACPEYIVTLSFRSIAKD
jgi:hypothetical protein